ncbi:uncharacterized protein LOC110092491 [Dendrobium catenatum]|uniref:uncharacterized protein LOC110092491 n=1 Tax=Dendrobium catenatum TaxID=906689 RepID=UPI0010A07500|nr:uncharacterized protein LOC110092491 [Dendrobium catenatum]
MAMRKSNNTKIDQSESTLTGSGGLRRDKEQVEDGRSVEKNDSGLWRLNAEKKRGCYGNWRPKEHFADFRARKSYSAPDARFSSHRPEFSLLFLLLRLRRRIMASTPSPSDFPPLPGGSSSPSPPNRLWKHFFAPTVSNPSDLHFTFHPSEPDIIPFSCEKLAKGTESCNLSLVGYSIGRRPFYEALLGFMKKTWALKGSLQLLSLSDGFFLLCFTCFEDYDKIWAKGVWFLLGKPFILHKWHPKFKPVKEDFSSVLIWIKIHDLPLACWNSEGISRIASKVGIPVAADNLTSQRTRLTFARVCVLVDKDSKYPEEIDVSLDGDVISLKVQYEWRPSPCIHCKSLIQFSASFPSNPQSSFVQTEHPHVAVSKERQNRGRSFSRKPNFRRNSTPRSSPMASKEFIPHSSPQVLNDNVVKPKDNPISNCFGQTLHYHPHSPTAPPSSKDHDPPPGLDTLDNVIDKGKDIIEATPISNLNSPNVDDFPAPTNVEDFPQQQDSFSSSDTLATGDKSELGKNLKGKQNQASSLGTKKKPARGSRVKNLLRTFSPDVSAILGCLEYQGLDMLYILENRILLSTLQDPSFELAQTIFPSECSCHNFDLSSSGRIWVKWNASKIHFQPSTITPRLISGMVHAGSDDRLSLWSLITNSDPLVTSPGFCWETSTAVGNKLTWFNQRMDSPIHIKLDRALVNVSWGSHFPNSFCSFQSPVCSDHCPVILHPGDVASIHHRQFKSAVKKENWAHYSNINAQLSNLHREQDFWMAKIQQDPLNSLFNASLKDINCKIVNLSSMMASWVAQRAKVNWLKHGEDDLKFLYAKIRSRRSKMQAANNLCHSNFNLEGIQDIIRHFQELYNPTLSNQENLVIHPIGSCIPECLIPSLTLSVNTCEIRKAVFSGSSTSSPAPDGFNFHFYKSGWTIIGPLLIKAVSSFFSKGFMPRGVKTTALALIPKHNHASVIFDFRPIALCNVIYKIIAKIIANRLAPIMSSIISNNQAGFVKSRVSIDNILLAKEILATCSKKGQKPFCAKIDIRKAFDTVSGRFLTDRLYQKGFLHKVVNWIKACINDVNFSIITKGALEGYFPSSAGLRQGFPLSPLLFCIAMDAFSASLDDGGFKGFSFDGYNISHLLYADDVLIFGEANVDNCNILTRVLNSFANSSGLHINLGKSCLPSINAIVFAYNCAVISRMYNSTSLFSTWLRKLYISPWRPPNSHATKFWKSICNTAVIAKSYFKFRISELAPFSILWDHWCNDATLSDTVIGDSILNDLSEDATVSLIISGNSWVLPDNLFPYIKNIITANYIHQNSDICLLWENAGIGYFSTYINGFYKQENVCTWAHLIWHTKSVLRYSVFSWMSVLGALKIADALLKRNILVPPSCGLCHAVPESTSLLFFECSYSYSVISRLLPIANGSLQSAADQVCGRTAFCLHPALFSFGFLHG